MLVIEEVPEASTLAGTEDVDALDDLRPGVDGLRVNTDGYRPATYLPKVLETFGWLLAFCLLLVALALALVRGWRLGLVALVTVPLSLLAATMDLQWCGEVFNRLVSMILAPLLATLPLRGQALMRCDSPVGRRLGSGYAGALSARTRWCAAPGGHPRPARVGDVTGRQARHRQGIGSRTAKGGRG
jgi:Cu/Ag efflux pump CusA